MSSSGELNENKHVDCSGHDLWSLLLVAGGVLRVVVHFNQQTSILVFVSQSYYEHLTRNKCAQPLIILSSKNYFSTYHEN